MAESETIAMAQKSRELRAQGKDIVNLSLGEPDFPTPDFIKDAAKVALDHNITQYPPVAGFPELKQAICTKLLRDNGLRYTPDQIVVSTGAKQSLMNAVLSLVNPGDEVVLPTPYWVSYREMVKFAEGTAVHVNTGIDQNFKITPEQLDRHLNDRTRLFIFSSPSNPTGNAYTEGELAGLAEVFERYPKVHIISDEIYEHIRFEGKHCSIASFESLYDRVVTVNGVSKAFAMTGWRIGYIAASKEIAAACTKVQGQFTSGANSIAQKAAQAALEADPSSIRFMVEAFRGRRELMIEGLEKIEGLQVNRPEGAFYLFPEVSAFLGKSFEGRKMATSEDLCFYLITEGLTATVPGSAFGAENYIRISYATSEAELRKALERINDSLSRLR